jgi:hypothetical protein
LEKIKFNMNNFWIRNQKGILNSWANQQRSTKKFKLIWHPPLYTLQNSIFNTIPSKELYDQKPSIQYFHQTIKLNILKHIIKFSFNSIINSCLTPCYKKKSYSDCDALPTPWGAQMWVPNWKQWNDKELAHALWLAAL